MYRKFVETSGAVEIEASHRIVAYLDQRFRNPILREANLNKDHTKNPVARQSQGRVRILLIPAKVS